jgi:hypothetical protein
VISFSAKVGTLRRVPEKVAVLHIGTHKTGTKSLQSMLADNPTWFAEQGLYYPATGRLAGGGHHNLAWELVGDPRFDADIGSITDLARELENRHPVSVFVSSEDFESLYGRTEALAGLRSALEDQGYTVAVVVVLRDPVEYLPSLYVELRKHGLGHTLDDFVDRVLMDGGIVFRNWDLRMDYEQLATGFANAFGATAVHAIRYQREDSVPVVLDAASVLLGVPVAPVEGWPRHNVRMPERTASHSNDLPVREMTGLTEGVNPLSQGQVESIQAVFGAAVDEVIRRYPLRAPGGDAFSEVAPAVGNRPGRVLQRVKAWHVARQAQIGRDVP